MEAILKFELPEDRVDFTRAINGSKLSDTLHEFDQWFRTIERHSEFGNLQVDEDDRINVYEFIAECRTKLRELCSDNDIIFDTIVQ